jgi:hypothetical protein
MELKRRKSLLLSTEGARLAGGIMPNHFESPLRRCVEQHKRGTAIAINDVRG